jgi:hypothetical protein
MVTIIVQVIHSFRKKIQSITCPASGRPSATTPLLHEGATREAATLHRCQVRSVPYVGARVKELRCLRHICMKN